MTIPVSAKGADAFTQDLDRVVRDPATRVYVDASFLMWMTRVGSPARKELRYWLKELCGLRLRVPVWAAHEYYRHHSEGTLVNDLDAQLEALEKAASGAYAAVWPLLDEVLGGAASPDAQRTEVRDALRAVPGVADLARRWKGRYDGHAREVIEFVNANALAGSQVPAYFDTIDAVASARFTGRVPPGFKDRRKKEHMAAGDGNEALVGSNRWGDFVFWREVLDDARQHHARRIVLLTRDAKNDWRMAGALPIERPREAGPDVPPDPGPGIPPAHPFLAYEAALEAGIGEVLLVDEVRLASLAQLVAEDRTRAFVFVARAPSLPAPKTDAQRRGEEQRRETAVREVIQSALATADGVRFLDPQGFRASRPILSKALHDSRGGGAPPEAVLRFEADLGRDRGNVAELLDGKRVADLGGAGLVHLARHVGRRAGQSGTGNATLSDLAVCLRDLPPKVASALYFGLLADAYLEPMDNSPRPAPRPTVLQVLFSYQSKPWAVDPIHVLRERLGRSGRVPLYLPDPLAPKLKLRFHAHGDQEPPTRLRSILLADFDLITPVQGTRELQLLVRLGGEPATPQSLRPHLVALYGLPEIQLTLVADIDGAYVVEPTTGFKAPTNVWLDPAEARP